MAAEELFQERWEEACYFHQRYARKLSQHPYLRDKLWDATVDGLLKALQEWDGVRPFRNFLRAVIRREWLAALRWSRCVKRDMRREKMAIKRRTEAAIEDRGQDIVDGRECMKKAVSVLTFDSFAALAEWLSGKQEVDLANESGLSRQTMHARLKSSIAQVRKAV